MVSDISLDKNGRSTVAAVFDALAPQYDLIWTSGLIGTLQRNQVWREIQPIFHSGEHVLEIGCGTGADAVHLAKMGVRVHAIDISVRMLSIARERVEREGLSDRVTFEHRAIEELREFPRSNIFDGVFSNFGAFNCIRDHHDAALALARLVRPGGKVVICYISRFCLWETVWYLSHAQLDKAFRRLSAGKGGLKTSIRTNIQMQVFYPSAGELASDFKEYFSSTSRHGIGVFVPPSFMENWVSRKPRFLAMLAVLDRNVRQWPILRAIGDHLLWVFTRTDRSLEKINGE